MEKYEQLLLKSIFGPHFFTNEDLRMNKKINILLNSQELREFLAFKDNFKHELKTELPLLTFNSSKMYYFNSKELVYLFQEYLEFLNNDLVER